MLEATDGGAGAAYRQAARAAGRVGIDVDVRTLGAADASTALERVRAAAADPSVDAMLLIAPLPVGWDPLPFASALDPAKDVDGAHPLNVGLGAAARPWQQPCTPAAALRLLDAHGVSLAGARAVVVGRSAVVGRPLARMLLERDATVTVCHSHTADLGAETRRAQLLLVAAGRVALVRADMVQPGATVVDIGTHVSPCGDLVGDVAPEVAQVAGALTPVPGGVGPVTTAVLMQHVWEAALWHHRS